VSQADDEFEREADRVADAVLAATPSRAHTAAAAGPAAPGVPAVRVSNLVQRLPDPDTGIDAGTGDEDEETLQMERATGRGALHVTSAQEARVTALRGGGVPLGDAHRSFFEPRFGHDFSAVRIHHDARAAQSARELGARAYTVGHDIVFGAGEFQPGSAGGRRLLAHELTHVVQQRGASAMVQRDVLQRDPSADSRCGTPPDSPASGAVARVQILQDDALVMVEFNDGSHFSTRLDRAMTRIKKGTYTAVHQQGQSKDCIQGAPDSAWHINTVPRSGGWAGIPSSAYELIVNETSPAFEPDPADIGKTAKAGKNKGTGDGPGAGKHKGDGSGSGATPGDARGKDGTAKAPGATPSGGSAGGQQAGNADEARKVLTDFQKQLGEAGTDATLPPDTGVAAALQELTAAERADLARYLRDAKAKAAEEGKLFDVSEMIKYYKNLSPSDRELLRTNLELSKSKTGATELPKSVQIALETSSDKTAGAANKQVSELNLQLGELARIHAKVTNPRFDKKDFEPINLDELPVFTEMMMLEGLLAGASSKSSEIEAISKELMDSIHGIRDYVLEEMAWLAAELAATSIIAALLAPVTAGLSELAETAEAAYVIKRLNDLRKFLQKVEKVYNTVQKIRALIAKVIGVYETYKRVKAQYDKWSTRLEKLHDMLEKAADAGDDIEDQIDKLEDEMIDGLQKSLDDPQGLGGLLEQFFIPADTSVDELKEILFNIPKGVEAFRDMVTFYGGVDRRNMEDIKTLAYKGVRAGVLMYPFVGYLALTIGNELKTLMQQPDLSERLLGIVTNAYDKASKRKVPTSRDNREKLKKVRKNEDRKKDPQEGDKKDKGKDPAKGRRKDKPKPQDDAKSPKKKPDDKDPAKDDARKKPDDEDPKKKKQREEEEQQDAEWQLVVAKVAALKDPYASKGAVKGDLLTAARRISKAHKTVAGGPKIIDQPGKGYWQVSMARKGVASDKASVEVLMHERTRFSKGRKAVEAKVATLGADKTDKASIGTEIQALRDAYVFKTLRVGDRNDGRQGIAVFGAMGTGSEVVLATIDDIKDMHFGTRTDPIPVNWYKQVSNYPKQITLQVDGAAKKFAMNSPELLNLSKRAGALSVFVGIDMTNVVGVGTLMQRKSTPRSGTKQDDYRKALKSAGFDWTGKDADHVRDLAFGGADDFDNLWPLDSKVNRWAYTGEWYMKYTVEYRDRKNLRQANEGTLYALRDLWFQVVGFKTTPAKMGGKTAEWKSPDKP
jgi:Domain of unknown function (DUF4157)